MIRTVTGTIEKSELGFCQCHEHLYIKEEIDDFDLSLRELNRYREAGGSSLVDCQPLNAGGNIEILKMLSLESGVNVIASTGFHKLTYYNKESEIYTKSANELADTFTEDLNNGTGIIKAAACGAIDGVYKKLHEAGSIAAKETNATVICHIDRDTSLSEVISFYTDRGVPPSKLILCHADRFVYDLKEHEQAAKEGAFLEYDTVAREKYHPDKVEMNIIKHMLDRGYVNNILISLDSTKSRLMTIGLSYLIKTFIPQLKENGVGDKETEQITRINCIKALSIE